MKKTLAIILTLAMILLLAACSGSAPAATAAPAAAPADAASSAADDAPGFTVGICQLVQHPALDAATEGFKEALVEKLGEA